MTATQFRRQLLKRIAAGQITPEQAAREFKDKFPHHKPKVEYCTDSEFKTLCESVNKGPDWKPEGKPIGVKRLTDEQFYFLVDKVKKIGS